MNVEIKANVKHTKKVLDNDKYFVIKTELFNKKNKLVSKAEFGFVNKNLNLEKFKKQVRGILGENYKLKILSNIEFKNKKEYEVYKSKM